MSSVASGASPPASWPSTPHAMPLSPPPPPAGAAAAAATSASAAGPTSAPAGVKSPPPAAPPSPALLETIGKLAEVLSGKDVPISGNNNSVTWDHLKARLAGFRSLQHFQNAFDLLCHHHLRQYPPRSPEHARLVAYWRQGTRLITKQYERLPLGDRVRDEDRNAPHVALARPWHLRTALLTKASDSSGTPAYSSLVLGMCPDDVPPADRVVVLPSTVRDEDGPPLGALSPLVTLTAKPEAEKANPQVPVRMLDWGEYAGVAPMFESTDATLPIDLVQLTTFVRKQRKRRRAALEVEDATESATEIASGNGKVVDEIQSDQVDGRTSADQSEGSMNVDKSSDISDVAHLKNGLDGLPRSTDISLAKASPQDLKHIAEALDSWEPAPKKKVASSDCEEELVEENNKLIQKLIEMQQKRFGCADDPSVVNAAERDVAQQLAANLAALVSRAQPGTVLVHPEALQAFKDGVTAPRRPHAKGTLALTKPFAYPSNNKVVNREPLSLATAFSRPAYPAGPRQRLAITRLIAAAKHMQSDGGPATGASPAAKPPPTLATPSATPAGQKMQAQQAQANGAMRSPAQPVPSMAATPKATAANAYGRGMNPATPPPARTASMRSGLAVINMDQAQQIQAQQQQQHQQQQQQQIAQAQQMAQAQMASQQQQQQQSPSPSLPLQHLAPSQPLQHIAPPPQTPQQQQQMHIRAQSKPAPAPPGSAVQQQQQQQQQFLAVPGGVGGTPGQHMRKSSTPGVPATPVSLTAPRTPAQMLHAQHLAQYQSRMAAAAAASGVPGSGSPAMATQAASGPAIAQMSGNDPGAVSAPGYAAVPQMQVGHMIQQPQQPLQQPQQPQQPQQQQQQQQLMSSAASPVQMVYANGNVTGLGMSMVSSPATTAFVTSQQQVPASGVSFAGVPDSTGIAMPNVYAVQGNQQSPQQQQQQPQQHQQQQPQQHQQQQQQFAPQMGSPAPMR